MKYYFEKDDYEMCYTKDRFIELMEERGTTEIEIYPAKMVVGERMFYCQEYGYVGESGEGCGRFCDSYKPRNGKNGRCRHHSNTYEPTDKPIKLIVSSNRD